MTSLTNDHHFFHHRYAFLLDNVFRRWLKPAKSILTGYINPGDTVIDIGCGPGFFTLPMTKMVGKTGKVIAVDFQLEMLNKISKKLANKAEQAWTQLHLCTATSLNLPSSVQADFILAFNMVHETPDQNALFQELIEIVKTGGKLLIVEPPLHVKQKDFEYSLTLAQSAGFEILESPTNKGKMSAVLTKSPK